MLAKMLLLFISIFSAVPDTSEFSALEVKMFQLYDQGNYAEAERFAKSIVPLTTGGELTKALINLGTIGTQLENYCEAEESFLRAIKYSRVQKSSFLPDALNGLGSLYLVQGKLAAARDILFESLSVTNPKDPRYLNTLDLIAIVYFQERNFRQAEEFYKKSLSISATDTTLNNLGLLYYETGRFQDAEIALLRSLKRKEKKFKRKSAGVATVLTNLGILYIAADKHIAAESHLVQSLTISEKYHNPHPVTARSLNNLGVLYYQQGKYLQAEPPLLKALNLYEATPELWKKERASTLHNLAALYHDLRAYRKAEELYLQSLTLLEEVFAEDNRAFVAVLENLAGLYHDQSSLREARPLYLRVISLIESSEGTDSVRLIRPLGNLALLYRSEGEAEKASELEARAEKLRTPILTE